MFENRDLKICDTVRAWIIFRWDVGLVIRGVEDGEYMDWQGAEDGTVETS